MLLTCNHHHHYHPFPHSSSFSSATPSLFTIIPSRPLHLNTPILNLKPLSTPHRFTSYTVHTNSFPRRSQLSVVDSNFDSFLSFLELSALLSSLVVSAAVAVTAIWKKGLYLAIGNRVAPWSLLLLVVGVLTGALIRRRKWRETVLNGVVSVSEVDFLQRIEKLEEDLKSNATVVRVLSRQLEKLGIRFRVTRKGLKEPITETASLAQKNSEAARALALQSDILEKELGEVQKVLLAMQFELSCWCLIIHVGTTAKTT
ncbi:transmembrane protein, putative [Medicago truncatula]|uniref:Transmembrane protein, putative n=1 Tax=Medicago truncatula TaxID=3880 RepID=A0A072U4P7_MEDTR|nr:transmembrane protein, putative [Medicago truncatula]